MGSVAAYTVQKQNAHRGICCFLQHPIRSLAEIDHGMRQAVGEEVLTHIQQGALLAGFAAFHQIFLIQRDIGPRLHAPFLHQQDGLIAKRPTGIQAAQILQLRVQFCTLLLRNDTKHGVILCGELRLLPLRCQHRQFGKLLQITGPNHAAAFQQSGIASQKCGNHRLVHLLQLPEHTLHNSLCRRFGKDGDHLCLRIILQCFQTQRHHHTADFFFQIAAAGAQRLRDTAAQQIDQDSYFL